jgi:hypothetical protein
MNGLPLIGSRVCFRQLRTSSQSRWGQKWARFGLMQCSQTGPPAARRPTGPHVFVANTDKVGFPT